jgi:hypothetical protein
VWKASKATWPAYIAKVGHQFYPAESLTEQLMTRIGESFGVDVARSRLMVCDGQLRFLSRHFLGGEDEILTHAAQILAGHLSDESFVERVAENKVEKEIFTFQVLCAAICDRFPASHSEILLGLVEMIGFDALVGNNDRHLYNWGVIESLTGSFPARFSPVFDTARGLFWNIQEHKLAGRSSASALASYVKGTVPRIGWDGEVRDIDHFELVGLVARHSPVYSERLKSLANPQALKESLAVVETEFRRTFSDQRRELIKRCLSMRFERFCNAL